ncbi:hypothetical protein N7U66_14555 [Lacinutrix neustonica]|uniref:Uncharacterized protein n=1 Tax=Lacinutrix neustonica TaxID=2980107 RepID=A0A9E8MTP7_9FLAO|nr:hypothetical protein [Lacinutrix neustonica]WAC01303.1 hypothetical protein N7U66_14555 [Lacinutrix neustonica]
MKRKLLIGLIMGFVLVSCYDVKKPKKPSSIISKDKMVVVLVDMSIMSSAKGVNKKRLEENGIVPNRIYMKNMV